MDKKAPISSTAHNARFIQAGVNAAFQDRIGKATDVEFNFLGPSTDGKGDFVTDQLVEARISSARHVTAASRHFCRHLALDHHGHRELC